MFKISGEFSGTSDYSIIGLDERNFQDYRLENPYNAGIFFTGAHVYTFEDIPLTMETDEYYFVVAEDWSWFPSSLSVKMHMTVQCVEFGSIGLGIYSIIASIVIIGLIVAFSVYCCHR